MMSDVWEKIGLDWEVVRFVTRSRDMAVIKSSMRELKTFALEHGRFHVVSIAERPGLLAWMQRLELTYYPPGTHRNLLFHFHMIQWDELMWSMISIPAAGERLARRSAEKTGMRIADGVPLVITAEDRKWFPIKERNVWSLESDGSQLQGIVTPDMLKPELEKADRILDAYRHSSPTN